MLTELKVIKYFVKISNQSLKRACFWSNIYGITINRSDLILFCATFHWVSIIHYWFWKIQHIAQHSMVENTPWWSQMCRVWCAQEELVFPSEELQGGVLIWGTSRGSPWIAWGASVCYILLGRRFCFSGST